MYAHARLSAARRLDGSVLRGAALSLLLVAASLALPAAAQDLSLTLADSADPVVAGNLLVYTISLVHNGGPDAINVAVTMYDPANTTLVTWQVVSGTGWTTTAPIPDPGPSGGFGVQFTKGAVTAAETATFTVTVRVINTTASGTILSGTADVTADVDTVPGNNSDTEPTTVSTQADLVLAGFNGAPDPVNLGNNVTYTYSVSNNGPSGAQTVTVTQAVPANTTFVSANVTVGSGWSVSAPSVGSTGTVQFSKGTMLQAEGAVFQVVVNVNLTAPVSIPSSATIASATTDPTPGNNAGAGAVTVNGGAVSMPLISVPHFSNADFRVRNYPLNPFSRDARSAIFTGVFGRPSVRDFGNSACA